MTHDAHIRRLLLPFVFRGTRLFAVNLRLKILSPSLADVLEGEALDLQNRALQQGLDGALLRVVDQGWRTYRKLDDRLAYVVRREAWHYLAWPGSFERYLEGRFSRKTAESFVRDEARFVATFGLEGKLDLREFSSPEGVDEFIGHARSVLTDRASVTLPIKRLQSVPWFGFVLFADDEPVSTMCVEAEGDMLKYVFAGERHDFHHWSAGSILHLAALRQLFADGRFRMLDFRPGEGEVKRQFANGSLRAATVLQLKRNLFHRLLLGAHALLQRRDEDKTATEAVSEEIQTLLGERA